MWVINFETHSYWDRNSDLSVASPISRVRDWVKLSMDSISYGSALSLCPNEKRILEMHSRIAPVVEKRSLQWCCSVEINTRTWPQIKQKKRVETGITIVSSFLFCVYDSTDHEFRGRLHSGRKFHRIF